ncbi:hypothetical protein LARI1_G007881 [Lachnellula arida]|uniref:Uncharacterized protein n=1 Tax=Lachnellula arida TaxID=1316785 RepID=A0A8T9B185_9HELO|nr:hypothetical protein LARI1_G007881 [Lachnellula arida]
MCRIGLICLGRRGWRGGWGEGGAVDCAIYFMIVRRGKFHMSPGFVGSHMYLEYVPESDIRYPAPRRQSRKCEIYEYTNTLAHYRQAGTGGDVSKYCAGGGDEVWVATREEIAQHFKKEFPYLLGYLAPGRKMGSEA